MLDMKTEKFSDLWNRLSHSCNLKSILKITKKFQILIDQIDENQSQDVKNSENAKYV